MNVSKTIHRVLHSPVAVTKLRIYFLGTVLAIGLFLYAFPGSPYFISGSLLVGGLIAWLLARARREYFPPHIMGGEGNLERGRKPMPLFGPDAQIEIRPWITGHPVGLVIAVGLGILLWVALPGVRMFLVGAVALGGLIGAVLWWKHR